MGIGYLRMKEVRAMKRAEKAVAKINAEAQKAPAPKPAPLETYPNGEQFEVRPLQVRSAVELHPTAQPTEEMPYDRMDDQGRRFLTATRPPEQIEAVTGQKAEAPQRFYSALLHGKTGEERVAHLVKALIFQKDAEGETAFDQDYLVLAPGTGSGFIEPEGPNMVENGANGKAATAAIQYNNQPSFMSIPECGLGKKEFELLLREVNKVIQVRKSQGRSVPKVVVLGESMGASVVARTIKGHEHELNDPDSLYHIDRMLLTGLPGLRWNHVRKLFKGQEWENGQVVSKDGLFAKINPQLEPSEWPSAPYVIANNSNDMVPRAGAVEGMVTKPNDWPEGVPFVPVFSFFKMMGNPGKTTRPPPGQFSQEGHDYRLRKCALVDFAIFDGKVPDEIVENSVERELQAENDREAQLKKK